VKISQYSTFGKVTDVIKSLYFLWLTVCDATNGTMVIRVGLN